MTSTIDWPRALLNETRSRYFLRHNTRSAGVSLTGIEQIITPNSSRWTVTLDLALLKDTDLTRAFDGFVTRMQGRKHRARIQLARPNRYGAQVSPLQAPFSDGTWFSDDTGFDDGLGGAHPMEVTIGAEIGQQSLQLQLINPTRPQFRIGDEFSYDDFLYRVTEVQGDQIGFLPRLRTQIPNGAVLQTDPPSILLRFATDGEGDRAREMLRYGGPISMSFVEAFDR